jgi:plastocyanin
MKARELIPLIVIISVILTIGGVLIASKLVPEENVKKFNPLSEISLKSNLKVIKTPTARDNTFIYTVNNLAEEALHIAQSDPRIKQIISEQKDKAVTIAAIQPTAVLQSIDNKSTYRSAGPGQIRITANWQYIDGNLYSNTANFNEIENKTGQSHQHIWNIFVDLDKHAVTAITEEPERIMKQILQPNIIYTGMNMFMPDAVRINSGSVITWINNSNLPHNVVGIYKESASGSQIRVDSGFIQSDESWRYKFNNSGVFEYRCTIHSEDGMKGVILVSS